VDHPDSISILDIRIDRVGIDEILAFVEHTIENDLKAIITYVNIHAMNLAYQIAWFRDFLNAADINYCDGKGVSFAARLLGFGSVPRQTPPDWISSLCSLCVRRDYSMYFIGSYPGIANKAFLKLKGITPDLNIVGTHHGYFDKQAGSEENNKLIEKINISNPDILWVGFGMPLQEKWLMENWDSLNVNVALTGGAIFDYISGEIIRGPRWMTDYGFEWLARLLIEPRRLWRRYIIGNPLFFWRILKLRFNFN
jgi:N-acetylglucosaminyldiphosphoundecaprenol N-acetyl-beta-D-mannosaminyltransferase